MKRFVIFLILVFSLTSHAYGMGWMGGGHNDNGSVVKTSGNAQSGTTGTTGNNGGNSAINNGPNNDNGGIVRVSGDSKNDPTGTTGNNGGNNGINNEPNNGGFIVTTSASQQGQSDCNTHAVPEPLTMLLLASGLLGLVGLRRKFKK
jgi:PEP-CTERM motif-containing protein